MKPKKFIHKYVASDIATVINEYILSLQTPEGENFKSVHILENTVMVRISGQTFIINIEEKDRLS
jgi:hypothetical protein